MYYDNGVAVHESSLKHGVKPSDAIFVVRSFIEAIDLDAGEPSRQIRIGFTSSGDLIEIVVLTFDSKRQMVIHAMPARRHLRSRIGQKGL
ncbi:toxin [Microbacteriaceae bacterium VKM Ac-2855]|nr:toxin [Microbacteriaceae bacterium VKM Ac-2855]